MRQLSKFLGENVDIYSKEGILLITGELKGHSPGFIINSPRTGSCWVSNRALCKKKISGIKSYQLVTRGNYDIFKKPKSGGFEYNF